MALTRERPLSNHLCISYLHMALILVINRSAALFITHAYAQWVKESVLSVCLFVHLSAQKSPDLEIWASDISIKIVEKLA